jgi:hypothetical protein
VLSGPSLLDVEKALACVHLYVGLMTLLFNLPSFGLPYPPYASVYPSVVQSALPSLHVGVYRPAFRLGPPIGALLCVTHCGLLNTVLFSTHNRTMLKARLGSRRCDGAGQVE